MPRLHLDLRRSYCAHSPRVVWRLPVVPVAQRGHGTAEKRSVRLFPGRVLATARHSPPPGTPGAWSGERRSVRVSFTIAQRRLGARSSAVIWTLERLPRDGRAGRAAEAGRGVSVTAPSPKFTLIVPV